MASLLEFNKKVKDLFKKGFLTPHYGEMMTVWALYVNETGVFAVSSGLLEISK
jgi:hypothetical protein